MFEKFEIFILRSGEKRHECVLVVQNVSDPQKNCFRPLQKSGIVEAFENESRDSFSITNDGITSNFGKGLITEA